MGCKSCDALNRIGLVVVLMLALPAFSAAGEDMFEPDNSASTARWLGSANTEQFHTFHSASDEDWYAFHESDPTATLTLTVSPDPGMNIRATLFAPNGASISSQDQGASATLVFNFTTDTGGMAKAVEDEIFKLQLLNLAAFNGEDNSQYLISLKRSPAVTTSSLSGTVKDSSTNLAIDGATVTLTNLGNTSTVTSNGGAYVFVGLPDANLSVSASANGFATLNQNINLSGNGVLNFLLVPGGNPPPGPSCGKDGAATYGFVATGLVLTGMRYRRGRGRSSWPQSTKTSRRE